MNAVSLSSENFFILISNLICSEALKSRVRGCIQNRGYWCIACFFFIYFVFIGLADWPIENSLYFPDCQSVHACRSVFTTVAAPKYPCLQRLSFKLLLF